LKIRIFFESFYLLFKDFCRISLMPSARSFDNDRSPDRRLRIGYISPDFREHSLVFFFEPILAHHDHRKFEVFCYANQPENDAVSARLRSHADHWRKIYSLSDAEVTDLIRKDEIDILIDLALHTQTHRSGILVQEAAPLQGSYLSYDSTDGLPAIDFRLTDAWVNPPAASEAHHTEKLVRLPDTQWVYRPPKNIPEVSALPADTNSHITFGIATNLAKINTATIAMWCQTLQAVPGSRLLIKGAGLQDTATRQYFLNSFINAGASEGQIFFEPSAPLLEYFQFFSRIDLVVDTYPFASGTTSCHALYMGVPMIIRTGNTSVSRVGASLLHNVDLTELIADSAERFVRIAADIAGDLSRLRQIRGSLRQTMRNSPLMNETTFVWNLEAAYRELWKEWCAGKPTKSSLQA
jgi:protein O-GlcNAc transferase